MSHPNRIVVTRITVSCDGQGNYRAEGHVHGESKATLAVASSHYQGAIQDLTSLVEMDGGRIAHHCTIVNHTHGECGVDALPV
jgi:hypothetical protein